MGISRGKYLTFVDADDAITKTALDELYRVAEKFQVDVVHCAEYFVTFDGSISTDKKILQKDHMETLDLVDKPTLFTNNQDDRVKNFVTGKFWTAPWNYFFRRDFLMRNQIKFPNLPVSSDVPFAFFATFLAESIVNAPVCYYVYRRYVDSQSNKILPPQERIEKRGSSIFQGLDCFENFMKQFEIFQNPDYRYAVYEFFLRVNVNMLHILNLYENLPAPQLDELIQKEFDKVENKSALLAYFFGRMNLLDLHIKNLSEQMAQAQK